MSELKKWWKDEAFYNNGRTVCGLNARIFCYIRIIFTPGRTIFRYYTISKKTSFSLGLLKLPEQIQQNGRIQIVKLTADCEFDALESQQSTVAVGLGRIDPYAPPEDRRLRHTPVITMSTSDCLREAKRPLDAFSVICAFMLDGRCASHGDSGNFYSFSVVLLGN